MAVTLSPHQRSLIDYYVPEDDVVYDLSEFFSVFADPTRLKILSALSITEMCVSDLCDSLGLRQSTVSHQLQYLRMYKMVKSRKEGKSVFYSIASEYIEDALNTGISFLGY